MNMEFTKNNGQAMRSVMHEGIRKGSGVVEDLLSVFGVIPRNNV